MTYNLNQRTNKMEITKKEILEKFTVDEMASLLVGAKMRTKTDKDLIAYLLERIKRLEEEMKDVVRNTKRKAKRD